MYSFWLWARFGGAIFVWFNHELFREGTGGSKCGLRAETTAEVWGRWQSKPKIVKKIQGSNIFDLLWNAAQLGVPM